MRNAHMRNNAWVVPRYNVRRSRGSVSSYTNAAVSNEFTIVLLMNSSLSGLYLSGRGFNSLTQIG